MKERNIESTNSIKSNVDGLQSFVYAGCIQRIQWLNLILWRIHKKYWMFNQCRSGNTIRLLFVILILFSFLKPLKKFLPSVVMLLCAISKLTRQHFNGHSCGSDVNLLQFKFSSDTKCTFFNPLQVHTCKTEFLQHNTKWHMWFTGNERIADHLTDILWPVQMYSQSSIADETSTNIQPCSKF